jgi:glucuronokinase
VILNIEKVELGISAGLQDRVIQTYGGLVHMDFTRPVMPTPVPVGDASDTAAAAAATSSPYTELDPALLPEMYLAYHGNAGKSKSKNVAAEGDSGLARPLLEYVHSVKPYLVVVQKY